MSHKEKDEDGSAEDQYRDRKPESPEPPDESWTDGVPVLPGKPDFDPWPERYPPGRLPGEPDIAPWPEKERLPVPQPARSASAASGEH